ncbi:MAG: hypothetical protein IMX04_03635 [Candidatus Carbobacillus altaicus]|uniref:Sporulation membrane protein YtrI C-terminal domain-containing protein n=1 Tax=Candidatus Carbonibacillus altaicus TaxID=2163959 RepID=A0A2R6Y0Z4_9BACL|nr:hypothetical protein [Candidatus Carbobacillus altaicus]PTQ56347.1 MAG: hypothetical protein BSOLF_0337 [Candidatus Carbobacillus altaicus]
MIMLERATKRFTVGVIIFFLGVLSGGILTMLECGDEMGRFTLENAKLRLEQEHLREQITELEKKAPNLSRLTVQDVTISIDMTGSGSEIVKQELTRRILSDTRHLLGKDLKSIGEMKNVLFELYGPRLYEIGGREVRIRLQTLVIAPVLELHFSAEP